MIQVETFSSIQKMNDYIESFPTIQIINIETLLLLSEYGEQYEKYRIWYKN